MTDPNDFYRELLEHLTDGIYFTDRERRIGYWNKGAEKLTGYTREEVIGKRCMDNILVHVDAAGRARIVEMMWEMVFADDRVSEMEESVVWRAADLLGVSSRERIELKRRVAADLGRRAENGEENGG